MAHGSCAAYEMVQHLHHPNQTLAVVLSQQQLLLAGSTHSAAAGTAAPARTATVGTLIGNVTTATLQQIRCKVHFCIAMSKVIAATL
jgi:hypothetical protein